MGFDTSSSALPLCFYSKSCKQFDLLKFDTDALIPFGSIEISSYLTQSLFPISITRLDVLHLSLLL